MPSSLLASPLPAPAAAAEAPPLVEVRGLTKDYGSFRALDACTLGVARGEVFGLLGPNGSGKTTLLRLLMGFLRPTAGTATIEGLDCYAQSVEVHRRVAYLPGEARLFRQMKGRDVLRFFCDMRAECSWERGLELAARLQLDLSKQVTMYSTGNRQKLALAASMAAQTPLVILDEPTSNLDPSMRSVALALVREARDQGRTVLFSSHVLSEVEQVCDRVVLLRQGRLVHSQVMAELRRQHRIRAELGGPLVEPPEELAGELEIERHGDRLTVLAPGELGPLLGWLARLPLAEVQIESVNLQAIYDRFHPPESA